MNKTISLSKDIFERCKELDNASATINELLEHYFNGDICRDEKILRNDYAEISAKKVILLAKMRKISGVLGELMAEKTKKAQENMSGEAKIIRTKEILIHKQKWKEGLISDEEYWSFYDK